MDDSRSGAAGTAPETGGRAETPPVAESGAGRPSHRPAVTLIVVLATLIVASAVGFFLLTDGLSSDAPGIELEGHWSGTGTAATCAGGFCPPSREIALDVECTRSSCTVPILDEPAELQEAGDGFTASGAIPPWHLDSCPGGGFVTGRWSLDLALDGEALVGRYTEETTSSCGPAVSRSVSTTEASWDLELTRA